MLSRKTRFRLIFISVCFVISLLITPGLLAQSDPNPNSPTPILLSGSDASRALAVEANSKINGLPNTKSRAFSLNSKVILFVTNVELMPGEGANAFRVYVKDANNHLYRFPVEAIDRLDKQNTVYALTVKLRDEIGFWEQPAETGDLLVSVTWRGLVSNPLLLGLGKTGGLKFETQSEKDSQTDKTPTSDYVGYRWSGDRKRFLEQATFGPTDELDYRVRRIGLRVWLAEQFAAPYPSSSNPYPNLELKPNNIQVGCPFATNTPQYAQCRRDYYSQYLLQRWFFKEAFYGEAQLRHRVAWALSQLWVTSGQSIQQASHMIAYHKILSNNAFGNYRNLMKEMTLSPAMGDYLDMATSTKNNPNENYSREILQLFTVGLFMLNPDGTLQLDGNNEPVPTYDQTTVNNFTKVFTGWAFCSNGTNPACPNAVPGTVNYIDPLLLNQNNHDVTAKTLLAYPNAVNQNISAGLNGNTELDLALDNIFYHPTLGPFVSKFLIQHLVSSDPTPAYVGRVTAVFNNNGQGVRGDLKAVITAILLDPEARGDEKTDPNFGKLREPVQLATNVYRHFKVQSANGTQQSDGYITAIPFIMGQNPFYPDSVFNYYPPNYFAPGTTLLAPEFAILNTGTAINRVNAATVMAFVPLAVDNRNPPNYPLGTSINVNDFITISQNDPTGNQLVDALDRKMLHSTMPPEMKTKILNAVLAVPADAPDFRARTAIFLIANSSQYQIQR